MRLWRYEVNPKLCRSCGSCLKACEAQAMGEDGNRKAVIDQSRCTACGRCVESCKLRAIVKRKGLFI